MKSIICAGVVLATVAAGADAVKDEKLPVIPKEKGTLTIEQLRSAKKYVRRPSGGFTYREAEGSKVIVVRNRQSVLSDREVSAAVETVKMATYLPIKILTAGEKRDDIGSEVVLVDKLDRPGLTLLAAPEQWYAELGTEWLVADSPSAEKRAKRVSLELFRAVGMSLGLGVSTCQPCIMSFVNGVKDLDRSSAERLGPDGESNLMRGADRLGIKKFRLKSYRDACQEGWASPPTNDIQKTIWDEVHKLPTNPLPLVKPTR